MSVRSARTPNGHFIVSLCRQSIDSVQSGRKPSPLPTMGTHTAQIAQGEAALAQSHPRSPHPLPPTPHPPSPTPRPPPPGRTNGLGHAQTSLQVCPLAPPLNSQPLPAQAFRRTPPAHTSPIQQRSADAGHAAPAGSNPVDAAMPARLPRARQAVGAAAAQARAGLLCRHPSRKQRIVFGGSPTRGGHGRPSLQSAMVSQKALTAPVDARTPASVQRRPAPHALLAPPHAPPTDDHWRHVSAPVAIPVRHARKDVGAGLPLAGTAGARGHHRLAPGGWGLPQAGRPGRTRTCQSPAHSRRRRCKNGRPS